MSKKIIFSEGVEKSLSEVLPKEEIRILLVMPGKFQCEEAELYLRDSFFVNKSTIYDFEGFGKDENEIELLVKQKYDAICLAEKFSDWEAHPFFSNGVDLAKHINEVSPKTIIILIIDLRNKQFPEGIKNSVIVAGLENLKIFHSEMKDLQEYLKLN